MARPSTGPQPDAESRAAPAERSAHRARAGSRQRPAAIPAPHIHFRAVRPSRRSAASSPKAANTPHAIWKKWMNLFGLRMVPNPGRAATTR